MPVKDAEGADDELDVSVVLPVYNEVGHVLEEVNRIRAALQASPVVDDCSTDGSLQVLEGIDDIRVIRSAKNRGSGAVRRTGTRAARGRVVVWTDADMSYPNEEIPRLVKELEGYDQVVGARTSEQGRARVFRVPAKWSIRKLASYLTDTKIPDLNSGLRAFRRDVGLQYVHMLPSGFSCVTTLTMTFLANGYSVKYVPIDYSPRAGYSKFHWWTDTRRYFVQVLRMVLTYDPLRIFVPASLVLGVPGVGKLVYDLVTKDLRIATNTLLLLFAALQVLVIGLLADLVVRLARPSEFVDPA